MRNAFIQELVSLARQHPQIALIVGGLGYSVIVHPIALSPDVCGTVGSRAMLNRLGGLFL